MGMIGREGGIIGGARAVAALMGALATAALAGVLAAGPATAWADEPAEDAYVLGETVNTGTDNGFRGTDALRKGDPHFDWELGRFSVTGYARVEEGADGVPTFVVAPGGGVALRFQLDQDIEALNLDPALSVNRDENGRDAEFDVPEQNLGRGALIVSRAPAGGEPAAPEVTLDFLGGTAVRGQAVDVGTFGEGDYRVALDYELREDVLNLLGISILPSFTDYRIAFSFNVRVEEGLEPGEVGAAPAPGAPDASGPTEPVSEDAEEPAPAGMPMWQIIIMIAAISIGGLMVIRGETRSGGRKRR